MSLKNKTEKFLIRKSLILFLVAAAISQIIFKINFAILYGLIIGYVVSILRLVFLTTLAEDILSSKPKRDKNTIIKYITVQMITITALFFAVRISFLFFLAVVIGVLTVPITIMINSFTEFLGATRNNFE